MPDEKEQQFEIVKTEGLTLVEVARSLAVTDEASHQFAGEFIVKVKQTKKRLVDGIVAPFVDDLYAAWKKAVARRKDLEDPFDKAVDIASKPVLAWQEKERQRIATEQARLLEDARKRQEEEALREAELLEKDGDKSQAAAVLDAAVDAPVYAPPPPPAPKVSGLSARDNYKFVVENPALLPREYMLPDLVKIGQIVRAQKGGTRIPGVRVYVEHGLAGTGR